MHFDEQTMRMDCERSPRQTKKLLPQILKDYVGQRMQHCEIHRGVLEVTATQKLSDTCEFDPEPFFQKVRDVAARMDSEDADNS